jgi:hypothetical protein
MVLDSLFTDIELGGNLHHDLGPQLSNEPLYIFDCGQVKNSALVTTRMLQVSPSAGGVVKMIVEPEIM